MWGLEWHDGGLSAEPTPSEVPIVNWTADGYRLSTNVEWESAARYIENMAAITPGDYASGALADVNNAAATGQTAWYSNNAGSTTYRVGTRLPNDLLIYDMSGNVMEFCWDWFDDYIGGPSYTNSDPEGPLSDAERTQRGAGYNTGVAFAQSAARFTIPATSKYNNLGFRVASD